MCESDDRSKAHSSTTTVGKPLEKASTTEARTQPLVLSPQTIRLSTPISRKWATSGVPKKQLARSLRITKSPGSGAKSGQMS